MTASPEASSALQSPGLTISLRVSRGSGSSSGDCRASITTGAPASSVPACNLSSNSNSNISSNSGSSSGTGTGSGSGSSNNSIPGTSSSSRQEGDRAAAVHGIASNRRQDGWFPAVHPGGRNEGKSPEKMRERESGEERVGEHGGDKPRPPRSYSPRTLSLQNLTAGRPSGSATSPTGEASTSSSTAISSSGNGAQASTAPVSQGAGNSRSKRPARVSTTGEGSAAASHAAAAAAAGAAPSNNAAASGESPAGDPGTAPNNALISPTSAARRSAVGTLSVWRHHHHQQQQQRHEHRHGRGGRASRSRNSRTPSPRSRQENGDEAAAAGTDAGRSAAAAVAGGESATSASVHVMPRSLSDTPPADDDAAAFPPAPSLSNMGDGAAGAVTAEQVRQGGGSVGGPDVVSQHAAACAADMREEQHGREVTEPQQQQLPQQPHHQQDRQREEVPASQRNVLTGSRRGGEGERIDPVEAAPSSIIDLPLPEMPEDDLGVNSLGTGEFSDGLSDWSEVEDEEGDGVGGNGEEDEDVEEEEEEEELLAIEFAVEYNVQLITGRRADLGWHNCEVCVQPNPVDMDAAGYIAPFHLHLDGDHHYEVTLKLDVVGNICRQTFGDYNLCCPPNDCSDSSIYCFVCTLRRFFHVTYLLGRCKFLPISPTIRHASHFFIPSTVSTQELLS